MIRILLLMLVLVLQPFAEQIFAAEHPTVEYDIVVYGGTPGGIAASLSAARLGCSVLLVEPTEIVGGMIGNGLTHPDFRTFESHNGIYAEFNARILNFYRRTYGDNSSQVQDTFRGTHSEPKVAQKIFHELLEEREQISVQANARLESVDRDGSRIRSIRVRLNSDHLAKEIVLRLSGSVFIDASYEGDLMAMAKVPYRVGRESRAEYNESLAPEAPDEKVQGYNFRLTMTNDPTIRVPVPKLSGYRRTDYLPLLELIKTGEIEKAVHVTTDGSNRKAIYKAHGIPLPNQKYDINDMSRGNVRLSLPQINNAWPDGDVETRRQIFEEHLRHNVGMLYFLQTDPDVPEPIRANALEWGLCRDEFVANNHLPYQLYIREARRMQGVKVFTQQNVAQASPNDPRAVLATDAIAMGDYGPNCHGTGHDGPRFGGQHTGEFYFAAAPYQIPYGVIVPKECENLLVPVACSASHVGFCALRLEPIWISLGEAAGVAASLSIENKTTVQNVSVTAIQEQLWKTGAATIYFSDLHFDRSPSADNTDFVAAQWWGTLGGFHGVSVPELKYGQRGKHLRGQYYHAFPGHAVKLDKPLDPELRNRWLRLATSVGLNIKRLKSVRTRRDFVTKAWEMRPAD